MESMSLLNPPYVVGLPTETVYGLAARVDCREGINAIFRLKERPFFDPLIVHISSLSQVPTLASEFPEVARILAEKFWPGPLTLILPKNEKLNSMITSGLDSVGLRMPRHPLALDLINREGPLAAPSANKFGRTSPTTAQHVAEEFGMEFPIIDGGACEVGLESTVLKITKSKLQILRPGVVTKNQITLALHEKNFRDFIFVEGEDGIQAPGQLKHHYMPGGIL